MDPKRRSRRPLTPVRLRRIAAFHLERFETSAEGLRRVLQRRIERAVREGRGEREPLQEAVEPIVALHVEAGVIDDRRFAEGLVRRLRGRGGSARKVRSALQAKGIDRDTVDAVLVPEEPMEDPEWLAALRTARRRRVGPYRTEPVDADGRRKELAILGRAGFGYDVARRVIDAEEGDPDVEAVRFGR